MHVTRSRLHDRDTACACGGVASRAVTKRRDAGSRTGLAVLFMPVATVIVHQLRYLLAYGPRAGRELAEQGDSYVHSLFPWLAGLLPLFLGALVVQLARSASASRSDDPADVVRFRVLWAGAFVALLAGYLVQESLEVLLGSAHATVLAQAFGSGGWWSVPAAAAVALAWALIARGARAVLRAVVRRGSVRHPQVAERDAGAGRCPTPVLRVARSCPLSRWLAGRAPPIVVSLI